MTKLGRSCLAIEIKGLTKNFDRQVAIAPVDLTLESGKIIGVAGPDGAGKTTFLRLLAAVLRPSQGSITIEGFDTVRDAEQVHALTGYMPQKFGLYEDLSVLQNLELYADLKGIDPAKRHELFSNLLQFTRLAPFLERLAGRLSGGMKQKLGLACALMGDPQVLILDEPSVGVDPLSRQELWQMVVQLVEKHIPVIWSTTYLHEVEQCDYVVLFNEGKVVFQGVPKDLSATMVGRIFGIQHFIGTKRQAFLQTLQHKHLTDVLIEGNEIRIVTKAVENQQQLLEKLQLGPEASLSEKTPRFEDIFIDTLGGIHSGESPLAKITKKLLHQQQEVIIAKDLTKKFGHFTAVDTVNFSVKSGEIFGLLGPNGAGKSTIFKMLCGLLTPTEGQAIVMGLSMQHAKSAARAQIGYMAQKFSLYGSLSVKQNLHFFSGLYNLQGKRKEEAVHQMIEIFDLSPYLNTSTDLLPLGFKQRLALSCAVMHGPSLLFLDEPTSGVDPITRREFWQHILCLAEKGVTIVVTTHFMDEAEYCDRVALIYQSKIIELGEPEELKAKAATREDPHPTLEKAFLTLIQGYQHA